MLVIYGGSFNPPTKAHKKVVELIKNKFPESKIIIVPVSANNYTWKDNLLDNKYRYEMLKLAFPDLLISDYEFKKEKYEGTYKLLSDFKKIDSNVYFVIGTDNLTQMPLWINFKGLIKEFKFIVIKRPTDKVDFTNYKGFEDNFIVLEMNSEISATQIRKNVDAKKDWLLEPVYEYIKTNNLYEVNKNE